MKPGPKTSEFQLTVAVVIGNFAAALAGGLSGQWAAIASAVAVGAYAYSRGQAKRGGGDVQP